MPLGDSITQGSLFHGSYRRWLWKDLKKAGYNVDFVGGKRSYRWAPALFADFDTDHEGHWGWRVDQILAEVDAWVEKAKPDLVLIHLGHNDVLQGQGVGNAVDELRQLIQRLRAHNPRLTLLVARQIPADGAPEIDDLGKAMPGLAASHTRPESPVICVDHWTGFDAAEDTHDRLHPNERGAKKMAAAWLDALRAVLPSP
jgi:lysophospholipase L1-like esterase